MSKLRPDQIPLNEENLMVDSGELSQVPGTDGSGGSSDFSSLTGKLNPVTQVNDASIPTSKLQGLGLPDGIATLDGTGKVPSSQLPSYIDNVIEYPNISLFPLVGEPSVIYVAADTQKTYRWAGSVYVEISATTVPTGDRGDITVSGIGGLVWTLNNGSVTSSKLSTTGIASVNTFLRGDMSWSTINRLLSGYTAPSSSVGVNGDFYINSATYELYGPKIADSWGIPISMSGQGIPAGGTAGQVLAKIDSTNYNTHWVNQSGSGGGASSVLELTDRYERLPSQVYTEFAHSGLRDIQVAVDACATYTYSQVILSPGVYNGSTLVLNDLANISIVGAETGHDMTLVSMLGSSPAGIVGDPSATVPRVLSITGSTTSSSISGLSISGNIIYNSIGANTFAFNNCAILGGISFTNSAPSSAVIYIRNCVLSGLLSIPSGFNARIIIDNCRVSSFSISNASADSVLIMSNIDGWTSFPTADVTLNGGHRLFTGEYRYYADGSQLNFTDIAGVIDATSQITDSSISIVKIDAIGTLSNTTFLRGDGQWVTVAGSLFDGNKGDITVSNSGLTWTVDNQAISYAKIQNVSDTNKLLGRFSAGTGIIEEITCTPAGRALLDDVTAAEQRTTLGLGTLATQNGTFTGTSSGVNTGDQYVFSTISVAGKNPIVADHVNDTLTFVEGIGITLDTDALNDRLTISAVTNVILNGSGAPTSGIGNDGDFYINNDNKYFYGPKTAGVWGAAVSIIGPAGATGADGADGIGVPSGGAAGQVLAKIDATDYNTHWITSTGGSGASSVAELTDRYERLPAQTNAEFAHEGERDIQVAIDAYTTGTSAQVIVGTGAYNGPTVTINNKSSLSIIGTQTGNTGHPSSQLGGTPDPVPGDPFATVPRALSITGTSSGIKIINLLINGLLTVSSTGTDPHLFYNCRFLSGLFFTASIPSVASIYITDSVLVGILTIPAGFSASIIIENCTVSPTFTISNSSANSVLRMSNIKGWSSFPTAGVTLNAGQQLLTGEYRYYVDGSQINFTDIAGSIDSTAQITDSSIPVAKIDATGTSDSTTFLRGDGQWVTVAGSLFDGNKGDITVSNSGLTWTVDNQAISYAKIQNVSATNKILGRSSVGSGTIEEIDCTAAGRALLDDPDAATQRITLGLGTLATQSGTFTGTSSGVNTGDQNLFNTIAVAGKDSIIADSKTDILTLIEGTGITLTTDALNDKLTISAVTNVVLNGSGAPTSGIGNDGDFYINTVNTDLYGPKTAGAWGTPVSLIGPIGPTGLAGRTILNGTVNPTSQGIDGDFYINTATNVIFGPKASGSWPTGVSIVGPEGPIGPEGKYGGVTFRYNYLSDTVTSDPGSTNLKLNNTLTAATEIYIDPTDYNSVNLGTYLDTIADSGSTIKAYLKIDEYGNTANFLLYAITGVNTASGYYSFDITYLSGNVSTWVNGQDIQITFSKTGDIGDTGPQGPAGVQGPAGTSVPAGGILNDILIKQSDTDYDYAWSDAITVDKLSFDPLAAEITTSGQLAWDTNFSTLNFGSGNVVQKIGLDQYYYIKNQSGATINKGRVVRATGSLGASGRILGDLALADNSIPPEYVIGIATENIVDGADGFVTSFGLIRQVDTIAMATAVGETWVDGDVLYLSATLAGRLTKVAPTAPNQKVICAMLIHHASTGSIFIRITNGVHLKDLHDVHAPSPSDGHILTWNASNNRWESSVNLNSGLTKVITQVGHGLNVGNVVRLDGNLYIKANADSEVNAEVVGIVSSVISSSSFILTTGGNVTGLSGLVAGTLYYLSPLTSGALTTVIPTASGHIIKPLLIADSTTSGYFYNMRGSTTVTGSGGGGGSTSNISYIECFGGTTNGTTNTFVIRYGNTAYTIGTDITHEFSTTLGSGFRINTAGIYRANAQMRTSGARSFAIRKGTVISNPFVFSETDIKAGASGMVYASYGSEFYCNAGDVIWSMCHAANDGLVAQLCSISISGPH